MFRSFILASAVLLALCGETSALVGPGRMCVARVHRSAMAQRAVVTCADGKDDASGERDVKAAEDADDDAAPDDDKASEGGDELLNSPAFLKKKIEVLEDELANLQMEKEELEKKLEEEANSPQVLRLQADFENLKRRTAEQALETRVLAKVDCVKQLLPVIDNFDRAAGLKTTTEDAEKIKSNYQQLYKMLLDVMTKQLGAEEIEAAGKEFDFNCHEAITSSESTEVADNHVIDVLQRGFTVDGKLVRPAGVRVSTGPGPSGGKGDGAKEE